MNTRSRKKNKQREWICAPGQAGDEEVLYIIGASRAACCIALGGRQAGRQLGAAREAQQ
jgi:hypothetical protein